MLEVARLMVDSGWAPAHPVIFLFNGAEELFMLVGHFSDMNFKTEITFDCQSCNYFSIRS